ncbi:MAG: hypothetical protein KIS81_05295 [Maricaulaceae bacterium]|nr:hypothetical protein [Maricaulaceae bacterium]
MRWLACIRPVAAAAAFLACGAAHAQLGDSRAPLDVGADRSEVFDAERRVVYSGDVDAIQGDVRLRADRVEVFFGPGAAGSGWGEVVRLVATGDVFYVTPREIIRADRGVYEIASETITMTGDVVLTQGCNVSTGARLVVNIGEGRSQLIGGQAEGQRVRSVFFTGEERRPEDECRPPAHPRAQPAPGAR